MHCWECSKTFEGGPYRKASFLRVVSAWYPPDQAKLVRVCVKCADKFDPPDDRELAALEIVDWNLKDY